jgi:hypothetical protein
VDEGVVSVSERVSEGVASVVSLEQNNSRGINDTRNIIE